MPPNQGCDDDGNDGGIEPCVCHPLSSQVEEHGIETPACKELHIAPMLNYSTREFRQLLRILSKRAVVWTEMVVDDTVQHAANLDEHLAYDEEQHPIVCQIGGNNPEMCGRATHVILQRYGYDEVNLNIDCPSDRVSTRREFGAILMKKSELALDIVREMRQNAGAVHKVSVKCRIGVDDWDDLEFAADFIRTLMPVCRRFYLHARKCVLNGLMNARQNRSVPPINYPRVYDLCRMFPDCEFWINGGIKSLSDAKLIAFGRNIEGTAINDQSQKHAVPCKLCNLPNGSCIEPPLPAPPNLRGCMMGRAGIDDPCLFNDVDRYFYGEKTNPCQNRREVLERYCTYLERIHPRRCCLDPSDNYCTICADIYANAEYIKDETGTADWSTNDQGERTQSNETKNKEAGKSKISSKIIIRSLKPVLPIFSGIPSSRQFRRVCDELMQTVAIRNCGPGYILRKAIRSVPSDILDRDF